MTGRERVAQIIVDGLSGQGGYVRAEFCHKDDTIEDVLKDVTLDGNFNVLAVVDALVAAAPPQKAYTPPETLTGAVEALMAFISDTITEADVDQPAGSGAGYRVDYDEDAIRAKAMELFADPPAPPVESHWLQQLARMPRRPKKPYPTAK